MKFDFHFGRKELPTGTHILVSLAITLISKFTKIPEEVIWDFFYDYLVDNHPDSPWIRELQKDPGIIERKVERTVDTAIEEYEKVVPVNPPDFTEQAIRYDEEPDGSVAQSLLGGTMGIKSPWVD
jgi:hypothetical protein